MAELFHVVAFSQGSSIIPTSLEAHALLMSYRNFEREMWFREQFPARRHQTLIPISDADFFNEQFFTPQHANKDIDILCITRLRPERNLPMLAAALKILRAKYPAITRRKL
jgi:glycosyltransferase involved in cell wall biosynthesis